MSNAQKSILYFGFYLYAVGTTLLLTPDLFLKITQLGETSDVWIRVVGLLAICLGYYYHQTAHHGLSLFYKFTIPTRILVFLTFSVFVLLQFTSPILVVIGSVDLLGALWTWQALKSENTLVKPL
ncbi:hypothetical protein [Spirosoma gilvum]